MTANTHALTMNGRIHGELLTRDLSVSDLIYQRLRILDGLKMYSFSLWKLPDGKDLDQVNLKKWPQEYIQVAGAVDRMTVEVRRLDGKLAKQFVVGRSDCQHGEDVTLTRIVWNNTVTSVFENEVFAIDEVVPIFVTYYELGSVPERLSLRLLAL